ncbi:MAG: DUF961 family protein [Oscillospiraceae bacterium]|nr:DUF961 family protein [Oscillospiraceae bacterium]
MSFERIYGRVPCPAEPFGDLFFVAKRERKKFDDTIGKELPDVGYWEYTLDSIGKGSLIFVRLPGDKEERSFKLDEKVELANSSVFPYISGSYPDQEVSWTVQVDDIRPVKPGQASTSPQTTASPTDKPPTPPQSGQGGGHDKVK